MVIAGGSVAAAAGVEALAGCGETAPSGETSLAGENTDAPQLRNYPYFASQSPALCSLLSFFDRHEALTVEAYTAHRNPERYVRPREAVFRVDYVAPPDQARLGQQLVAEYQIQKLTSCSTCHR